MFPKTVSNFIDELLFLAYNHSFEVVLANHWLAVDYPQEVAKIWPGVLNWKDSHHRCGSLWLRKK